jgi:hypothetical protein
MARCGNEKSSGAGVKFSKYRVMSCDADRAARDVESVLRKIGDAACRMKRIRRARNKARASTLTARRAASAAMRCLLIRRCEGSMTSRRCSRL